MIASEPLEVLADKASHGDARALDRLVRALQDPVYGLAMRFLGSPGDAEDATQEILMKVVTHLGTFRGESKLLTWVYRVAANHLIGAQRKRARLPEPTFEFLEEAIDGGVQAAAASEGPSSPVDKILVDEMRLTCTQGMLQALDRDHRLAFVLAEIMELSGEEGASILGIQHDTFRKRVSRARERLADFMKPRCGVYDAKNLCRCDRQVKTAVSMGLIEGDPSLVQLARHPRKDADAAAQHARELEGLLDVAAVMRTHPTYAAPDRVREGLRTLLLRAT